MINFLFCCHKANITLPVVNVFSVSSILKRFHKKSPRPWKEPPVPPITLKEPSQPRKKGSVNTEDLLQLSLVVDYPVYPLKTVNRFSIFLISEEC